MNNKSDDRIFFDVAKEIGQPQVFALDPEIVNRFFERLLQIFESLPIGGRVIFDFSGVQILSPTIVTELYRKAREEPKGLLDRRPFIVKDPNDDVRSTLTSFLKEIKKSALLFFSNGPEGPTEETINLPPFLQETRRILARHPRLSPERLATFLAISENEDNPGKKITTEQKKPCARERLRRLYDQGLVIREPGMDEKGKLCFTYENLTMINT